VRVHRLALWLVSVVACARAGPGDAPGAAASSGSPAPIDEGASGESDPGPVGTTGDDEGVVGGSGSTATDSGTSIGVVDPFDAGPPETADANDGMVESRDANFDGSACLLAIPSSCPSCMTQNASDQPACQMYIQCFIANDCDPSTDCGSNDGVCGVNTIGGGEAPYTAAVATYDCACP
jgi:hypothetical protein